MLNDNNMTKFEEKVKRKIYVKFAVNFINK